MELRCGMQCRPALTPLCLTLPLIVLAVSLLLQAKASRILNERTEFSNDRRHAPRVGRQMSEDDLSEDDLSEDDEDLGRSINARKTSDRKSYKAPSVSDVPVHATPRARVDVCLYVRGVTQLHDRVYVACAASSTLHVFAPPQFHRPLPLLIVPGMTNPRDLAACPLTGSLYVLEGLGGEGGEARVWRASVLGEGKTWVTAEDVRWTLWLTGPFWSHSLSVTPRSGHVLLLSRTTLTLYDPQATPLRRVPLPRTLPGHIPDQWPLFADPPGPMPAHARHAVETPRGTFYVCHGWGDDDFHGVSEIDGAGRVLRHYGGLSGSEEWEFHYPTHLALDPHGRGVLVSDSVNYRVIVLTSDLTWGALLANGTVGGVVWPSRLSLDEGGSGQLVVGLVSGNPTIENVLVFDIQP